MSVGYYYENFYWYPEDDTLLETFIESKDMEGKRIAFMHRGIDYKGRDSFIIIFEILVEPLSEAAQGVDINMDELSNNNLNDYES